MASEMAITSQPLHVSVPQLAWFVHPATKSMRPSLYLMQPAGAPLDDATLSNVMFSAVASARHRPSDPSSGKAAGAPPSPDPASAVSIVSMALTCASASACR